MESVVGELQGPSVAGSNLLGLPELCPWDTDDELLGLGGIKPKSSPIPRRRSSSSSCSDDESQPPPSSSRRVSFADAFGFSLVSVKQFDTWSVCDPSDPLEGDPKDTREYILNMQFALPLSQEELLCKVQEQKIELESLEILPGTTTLKGIVRVLNLCFDKLVYIRTSLDCWSSHFDLLAQYLPGSDSRDTDRFSFKLTLVPPFGEQGARVDFCLRYETRLGTFWSSNSGKNYVLFCHEKAKEQEDNESKYKPKSCLKPTSYGLPSKTGATSSTEKNPEIIFNCETSAVNKPVSIKENKVQEELQVENCRNQSRKSRRKAARMEKIQQYFAQREENNLHHTGDVTSETNLNEQVLATEGAVLNVLLPQAEITETVSPSLTEPNNYEEQKCSVNTKSKQVSVAQTEKEHTPAIHPEIKMPIAQATSPHTDSEDSHKVLETGESQSKETLTGQTDLLKEHPHESQNSDKAITKSVEKAWECFEKGAVRKTGGILDVSITESKASHEDNTNNSPDIQPFSQNFTFATIVAPLYHQVFERLENERRDPMSRAQKCKAGEYFGKLEDGSLRAVTSPSYPRVQRVEPRPNPCMSEKQDVYQGTCKKTCSPYVLNQKDTINKPAAETELDLIEHLDNPTQAVTSMQTLLTSNLTHQLECSPNTLSWEESTLDQAEEIAEMILQNDSDPSLKTRPYNEVPKQDKESQATTAEGTLNTSIKFLNECHIAIPDSLYHSDILANVKPGISQVGAPMYFQNVTETIQIPNQTSTFSKLSPDTIGTNLFQELHNLSQEGADLHHVGTDTESKSGGNNTNETASTVVFPINQGEMSEDHLQVSQETKDTTINVPDWIVDSNLDLGTDQQSVVISNKPYTSVLAGGEASDIYEESKWKENVDKNTNQDLTNIKEHQSEERKMTEEVEEHIEERTDFGTKALCEDIPDSTSTTSNYKCALPQEEADISEGNICVKDVYKNIKQDPIVMKEHQAEIMKEMWEVEEQQEDKVEVILQTEPSLVSTVEATPYNTALQNKHLPITSHNIPISLDCKILTQQSELNESTFGKSSAVQSENLPSVDSLVANLSFTTISCDNTSKQDKDDQAKTADGTLNTNVKSLEESHIPIPDLVVHFNIPSNITSDISQSGALLKFDNQIQDTNQTQSPGMTSFTYSPQTTCITPVSVQITEGTNSIYESNYISQEGDYFSNVDRDRESGSGKNDEDCSGEKTLTLSHPATENTLRETVDQIPQKPQDVSLMKGNQVPSILNLNIHDEVIDSIRTLTKGEDQISTVSRINVHKSASSEKEAVIANERLENADNSKEKTDVKEHQFEDINKVQEVLEEIEISEHSLVSTSEDTLDNSSFQSKTSPENLSHIALSSECGLITTESELDTKKISEPSKTTSTTCIQVHIAKSDNLLHESNDDSHQFDSDTKLKSEHGAQERNINEDQQSTVNNSDFHKRASTDIDTNDNNDAHELTVIKEDQSEEINEIKEVEVEKNHILESLLDFDIASNVTSDFSESQALINSQNLIQGTKQTQNNNPERTGNTHAHITEDANLVQESNNSCYGGADSDHVGTETKIKSSKDYEDDNCVGTLTLTQSATETTCTNDSYINPKLMTVDTIPPINVHISQTNQNQESILYITATVNNNVHLDVEQERQGTSKTLEQESKEQWGERYLNDEEDEVCETDLTQHALTQNSNRVDGLDYNTDSIELFNIKDETCCQTEKDKAASNDNSENMDDSASTESMSDDEMELYLHRLKKTQQPGFKEVVSMAKRPSISRTRTIPSPLPSISEYVDEDQPNALLDDLSNEEMVELERATLPLTKEEEVVIRKNLLWREIFPLDNVSQIILYTFLLIVFLVATYFCDFIACFGLYLLAVYCLYFQQQREPLKSI